MEVDTDVSRPAGIALLSAVLTGIAAFLPWMAGVQAGPVDVNTTQTGIEGLGILTLLLALIVIGAILLTDIDSLGPVTIVLAGAIVTVVSLWKLIDLADPVSPGIGLYLTIIGGLGIVVGGGLDYRDQPQ